ncbi:MAG: hypothetical protein RL689_1022, partial [Planctomycetota bacterium]
MFFVGPLPWSGQVARDPSCTPSVHKLPMPPDLRPQPRPEGNASVRIPIGMAAPKVRTSKRGDHFSRPADSGHAPVSGLLASHATPP